MEILHEEKYVLWIVCDAEQEELRILGVEILEVLVGAILASNSIPAISIITKGMVCMIWV